MKTSIVSFLLVFIGLVAAETTWILKSQCVHSDKLSHQWYTNNGPMCVVLPFKLPRSTTLPKRHGNNGIEYVTFYSGCCIYTVGKSPHSADGHCYYSTKKSFHDIRTPSDCRGGDSRPADCMSISPVSRPGALRSLDGRVRYC